MIRVRIELCPRGDESPEAVTELGRMYIANDGTGTRDLGDYKVAVCKRGTTAVPKPLAPFGPCPTRGGAVLEYPRLKHNVWRLIARALHVAFPEELMQSKRKAGDRSVLDEATMRGLQLLRRHVDEGGHDWTEGTSMTDVEAANDWLRDARKETP